MLLLSVEKFLDKNSEGLLPRMIIRGRDGIALLKETRSS